MTNREGHEPLSFEQIKEKFGGEDRQTIGALVRAKAAATQLAEAGPDPNRAAEIMKKVDPDFTEPVGSMGGITIFESIQESVRVERERSKESSTPLQSPDQETGKSSGFLGFDEYGEVIWSSDSIASKVGTSNVETQRKQRTEKIKRPKKKRIVTRTSDSRLKLQEGYTSLSRLTLETGISRQTLLQHLGDVPGMQRIVGIGYVFPEEEVHDLLAQIPREDELSPTGPSWVGALPYGYTTTEALHADTSIDKKILNIYLQYIPGRRMSEIGFVFPKDAAEPVIPQLVEELAADPEPLSLVTRKQIQTRYGYSYGLINSYLATDSAAYDPSETGEKHMLYDEKEVTDRIQRYENLPVVSNKTGMYQDDSGEVWAYKQTASRLLRVNYNGVVLLAGNAEQMDAKDNKGSVHTVYKLSDLQAGLPTLHSLRREQRRKRGRQTQQKLRTELATTPEFTTYRELCAQFPDINPERIRVLLRQAEKDDATQLAVQKRGGYKVYREIDAAALITPLLSPDKERTVVDGVPHMSARQFAADLAKRGIHLKEHRIRGYLRDAEVPHEVGHGNSYTVNLYPQEQLRKIVLTEIAGNERVQISTPFGEKLWFLRLANRQSPQEFAESVGVSVNVIKFAEEGTRSLPLKVVNKIIDATLDPESKEAQTLRLLSQKREIMTLEDLREASPNELIRYMRIVTGLSRSELGEKLDKSTYNIRDIESGRTKKIDPELAAKITDEWLQLPPDSALAQIIHQKITVPGRPVSDELLDGVLNEPFVFMKTREEDGQPPILSEVEKKVTSRMQRNDTLGQTIQILRKSKKMTQKELSDSIVGRNITQGDISSFEHGKKHFLDYRFASLLHGLGYTVDNPIAQKLIRWNYVEESFRHLDMGNASNLQNVKHSKVR